MLAPRTGSGLPQLAGCGCCPGGVRCGRARCIWTGTPCALSRLAAWSQPVTVGSGVPRSTGEKQNRVFGQEGQTAVERALCLHHGPREGAACVCPESPAARLSHLCGRRPSPAPGWGLLGILHCRRVFFLITPGLLSWLPGESCVLSVESRSRVHSCGALCSGRPLPEASAAVGASPGLGGAQQVGPFWGRHRPGVSTGQAGMQLRLVLPDLTDYKREAEESTPVLAAAP